MPLIHPTAVIDPAARLAPDVRVGPFVVVDGPAVVGPGCVLHAGCQLVGRVTLGADNQVGPGTVLGGVPQHLAYAGEDTAVVIGDGNTFREHCTVHRGMATAAGVTRVGNRNYFMTGSHVGHDAVVGDHVIAVNCAAVGGHAEVGDRALLSAHTGVHQFVRVGRLALLGGGAVVTKDVPPFWLIETRNLVGGVNVVGMRRAGMANADILAVRAAFKLVYFKRLTVSAAVEQMDRQYGHSPAVRELVAFIRASKRGVPGPTHYRGDAGAEAA